MLLHPVPTCTASRSVIPSPIMITLLYGHVSRIIAMAWGLPWLRAVGTRESSGFRKWGGQVAAWRCRVGNGRRQPVTCEGCIERVCEVRFQSSGHGHTFCHTT